MKGPLVDEANMKGLVDEANMKGLVDKANMKGLVDEANMKGLVDQANMKGLIDEANFNPRLAAEQRSDRNEQYSQLWNLKLLSFHPRESRTSTRNAKRE